MNDNTARSESGFAPGPISSGLPEFERPPVVEVAISVQFDELARLQPAYYGLLWQRFRHEYPRTEHHPPLSSIVELFDAKGISRASLSIEPGMPAGRCWFLSVDRLHLIQVQPDRFVMNWRKLDTDAEYPRYHVLRELFTQRLGQFVDFISDEGLGEFHAMQCELTYVNHIISGEGWHTPDELANVLTVWSDNPLRGNLPPLEEARLSWQYRMEGELSPFGRLHVNVQPAVRVKDARPLLRFSLTARGAPTSEGLEGVLGFTDKAHEWIVRGFSALTTERMHQVWGRTR